MKYLNLQPVQVCGYPDSEGQLVFADEDLVAVLVHLSEDFGDDAGDWYIEAAFGPSLTDPLNPMFHSLDEAVRWIDRKIQKQ